MFSHPLTITFCCFQQWWHARNKKTYTLSLVHFNIALDPLKLLSHKSEKITKLPYRFDILFIPIWFNLSTVSDTPDYSFSLGTISGFHNTSLFYTTLQWPFLRAHIWVFSFLHFLCHHSTLSYISVLHYFNSLLIGFPLPPLLSKQSILPQPPEWYF